MIQKWVNAISLGLAITVASCGGGTDVAGNGIGSGGTGSYTSGPVSGFGSIIVNGVRYNVDAASVVDDDGQTVGQTNLRLGMYVEVEGSSITTQSGSDKSTAARVRVNSDFVGPVNVVSASELRIWGRTVKLNSKTVMDGSIASRDIVEVFGYLGPEGYVATRVEKVSGNSESFKVTGRVASWNSNTRKLALFGQQFNVPSNVVVPSGLKEGAWVKVKVDRRFIALLLLNQVDAIDVSSVKLVQAEITKADVARIKGVVVTAVSNGRFTVNRTVVDAGSLSVAGISLGARVEVRGRIENGVLYADRIEVEDDVTDEAKEIELYGFPVDINMSLKTLTVRGVPVVFDSSSRVEIEGNITQSMCLKVKGRAYSAERRLIATEIKLDSDCR